MHKALLDYWKKIDHTGWRCLQWCWWQRSWEVVALIRLKNNEQFELNNTQKATPHLILIENSQDHHYYVIAN